MLRWDAKQAPAHVPLCMMSLYLALHCCMKAIGCESGLKARVQTAGHCQPCVPVTVN